MSCFPAGLPAAAARAVKDEGGEGSPVLFLRDKVWNMAACFSAKGIKVKEGDKIIQP